MSVIKSFWRNEQGAYAVMYAFMIPMIVGFFSVMIDGSTTMTERTRLNDGLNQGVLAVTVMDNRNATAPYIDENNTLLTNYLKYYTGANSQDLQNVKIDVKPKTGAANQVMSVVYQGSATLNGHPILMESHNASQPGFSHNITINKNSDAGIVQRSFGTNEPMDLVFVTDFSGSMNDPSNEPGLTRLELLQKFINDSGIEIFQADAKNTIGIVPFAIGVPVKLKSNDILGREEVGCSFIGALKPEYSSVDLDYWYDKNVFDSYGYADIIRYLTPGPVGTVSALYHNAINAGSRFFQLGTLTNAPENIKFAQLSQIYYKTWCTPYTLFPYVAGCEFDPNIDMINHASYFNSNALEAARLAGFERLHLSAANTETMDFNELFSGDYLFTDSSVTTFKLSLGPATRYFQNMCRPISTGANDIASPMPYYLIELTSNPNLLIDFNHMSILSSGGTDSNTGLLRSVPVIAKGKNSKKAIVVISDGLDLSTPDGGPLKLRDELHKNKHICQFITNGLKQYSPGTTQADIYFVSVTNDPDGVKNRQFWADNCTGDKNAIVATSYKELMALLTKIIQKPSINFINKDDAP